jgi:hypothetical protein
LEWPENGGKKKYIAGAAGKINLESDDSKKKEKKKMKSAHKFVFSLANFSYSQPQYFKNIFKSANVG